jgi:gluconokinase
MVILVIDIGSSSVRALLFDHQPKLIADAVVSHQHQFTTSPPGAATMDMITLQSSVETCIDEILTHPLASAIQVVGMATFVGNILGIDEAGKPITPVYTYADTRSADDVEQLRTSTNVRDAHQRTGCMTHTAYLPGRLSWLRRTEPELFSSVRRWLDVGTYLYSQWFGEAQASYSVSSWSGMLNRNQLEWDDGWLTLLGLDKAVFPILSDYNAVQAGLNPIYARRWSALKDTPFCLAVGDGAAANIGSGCIGDSYIALTVGTTAALRIAAPTMFPHVPDGLWDYRVTADLHLVGGATSEGGNIYHWLLNMLGIAGKDLERQLAQREADSHGLTFLPLLAGERSPGWATDATGAVVGLRLSTIPIDILQAVLEGVALRLSVIAEQLSGIAKRNIVVVGGGGALMSSPAWTQIIANAINLPIHVTSESEVTARGVAILALAALNQCSPSAEFPAITNIVYPQSGNVSKLKAARQRQVELYSKLVVSK